MQELLRIIALFIQVNSRFGIPYKKKAPKEMLNHVMLIYYIIYYSSHVAQKGPFLNLGLNNPAG